MLPLPLPLQSELQTVQIDDVMGKRDNSIVTNTVTNTSDVKNMNNLSPA